MGQDPISKIPLVILAWVIHQLPSSDSAWMHPSPSFIAKHYLSSSENRIPCRKKGGTPHRSRRNRHLPTALRSLGEPDDDHDSDPTDLEAVTLRAVTFCNLDKGEEPALLCDFLLELGACSASMTDADRGTDREVPLFGEPTRDNLSSTTNSPATMWNPPVWNKCNVTAHFPASIDLASIMETLQDVWPTSSSSSSETVSSLQNWRIEQVPNKDWVVHVQQNWEPILVANKFLLRFPWHSDDRVQKTLEASSRRDDAGYSSDKIVQLRLQGGIAFGTGEHPTTQLCLHWIDQVVNEALGEQHHEINPSESPPRPLRVLDYGSGSGILGLAACALAPGRVAAVGMDIDADACIIANENARINQLPMQSYLPPLLESSSDPESQSLLLKAYALARRQLDDRDRQSPHGQQQEEDGASSTWRNIISPPLMIDPTSSQPIFYDVCVANILAAPLVELAPTLWTMIRPSGGRLGLSGILAHQGDLIVQAYQKAGFAQVQVAQELGGWLLVTAVKP